MASVDTVALDGHQSDLMQNKVGEMKLLGGVGRHGYDRTIKSDEAVGDVASVRGKS